MRQQLRVRKAKYSTRPRPWVVRTADTTIIGRFTTGTEALEFVRRVIDAAA